MAGFIATIWVANWLVQRHGMVPVGLGLVAPAGVYAAGVTFTLRDVAHRALGPRWVIAAVVVGAALAGILSTRVALASGFAFLVSELCDHLVFTPLHERTWVGAVLLSNVVGLMVDSVLFLWLAFGSLNFLWGQAMGKAWMTVITVAVLVMVRRGSALLPRHA